VPRDGAGLRETLVRRAVSAHALTRLRGATLPALLLIAAIVSLRVAPGPAGVCGAFLAACMLAIAAVDARRFLIPDALTASAFAAGALAALLGGADAGAQQLACALLRAAAAAKASASATSSSPRSQASGWTGRRSQAPWNWRR
jgi:prepilin signal peptidase PulO-like enzyme (type II secretory pathway)